MSEIIIFFLNVQYLLAKVHGQNMIVAYTISTAQAKTDLRSIHHFLEVMDK